VDFGWFDIVKLYNPFSSFSSSFYVTYRGGTERWIRNTRKKKVNTLETSNAASCLWCRSNSSSSYKLSLNNNKKITENSYPQSHYKYKTTS
jgi:hypothetical protein